MEKTFSTKSRKVIEHSGQKNVDNIKAGFIKTFVRVEVHLTWSNYRVY